MMNPWLCLALAIMFEVAATTALKASHGFSRLLPTFLALGGYALAFYMLSLTLRTVPLGVAYAIWSGVGTVTTALIGWAIWNEALFLSHGVGIALILCGVMVLNLATRA